jgi:hypothetical protein
VTDNYRFRKPARCEALDQDGCVEIATNLPGRVALRDSSNRLVEYDPQEWERFLNAARAGEFDLGA